MSNPTSPIVTVIAEVFVVVALLSLLDVPPETTLDTLFKATAIIVPRPPPPVLMFAEKFAVAVLVPVAGSAKPNTVTMLSSVHQFLQCVIYS